MTDEMLADADVNQLSLILKESHHYDFITFILACGGLKILTFGAKFHP